MNGEIKTNEELKTAIHIIFVISMGHMMSMVAIYVFSLCVDGMITY
jgi:hypothetical protein